MCTPPARGCRRYPPVHELENFLLHLSSLWYFCRYKPQDMKILGQPRGPTGDHPRGPAGSGPPCPARALPEASRASPAARLRLLARPGAAPQLELSLWGDLGSVPLWLFPHENDDDAMRCPGTGRACAETRRRRLAGGARPGALPAAATSAPSPPHGFSPRPALALAAPFGTHRSYPSSHITSSATPAAAPGDAPLTRARRAAEQAAPRRTSAGSTSGASRFRLGDTEGHGGAQAQLPATVLSPETRLVRRPGGHSRPPSSH